MEEKKDMSEMTIEEANKEIDSIVKDLEDELEVSIKEETKVIEENFNITDSMFFKHSKLDTKLVKVLVDIYYMTDLNARDRAMELLVQESDHYDEESKKIVHKVNKAYHIANFEDDDFIEVYKHVLTSNLLKVYGNEVRLRRAFEDLYLAKERSGLYFNAFLPDLVKAVLVHFGFRFKNGDEKKYNYAALFTIALSKLARKLSPYDAVSNYMIMLTMKNISNWSFMTSKQLNEYPKATEQIKGFFKFLFLIYTSVEISAKKKENVDNPTLTALKDIFKTTDEE